MRYIISLLCVLAPSLAFGTYPIRTVGKYVNYDDYNSQQFIIIQVPATDLGLKFYYDVSDDKEPTAQPEGSQPGLLKKDSFGVLGGEVKQLVMTRCGSCHKPGQVKPDVQLLTAERTLYRNQDIQAEKDRSKRVYESIEDGSMPKNGKLTPEQKKLLLGYYGEK